MVRYSPALIASIRYHCEHTDDSQRKIAAEHGISLRTLQRMVVSGGWARRADRPPRELPADLRLLQEANALATQKQAEAAAPSAEEAAAASDESAPTQPERETLPAALDRIERLVEKELASEEAARAQLGRAARSRVDAEKTARTLANLTQTLRVVQELRHGHAGPPDPYDDDMPHDIDAFRIELARRIDAFVASRTDPEMMKEIDAIHAKYAAREAAATTQDF